jgi:hypothetical protein
MELQISLSSDLSDRLSRAAEESAVPPAVLAVRLLDKVLPPARSADTIALLQSWIDEANPSEQQETGEFLIRALDADRSSDRKLFPPELKGVTW